MLYEKSVAKFRTRLNFLHRSWQTAEEGFSSVGLCCSSGFSITFIEQSGCFDFQAFYCSFL